MTRYNLHETLVVRQHSSDRWKKENHNQNYFEIIFIEYGSGYISINGSKWPYKEKDIFILAPDDRYDFEIEKHSTLSCFTFTELLLSNKVNLPDRQYWLQRIEQILQNYHMVHGDVMNHEEDRNIIWNIFRIIMTEFKNEKSYHQEIISDAISTILSLIIRNISDNQNLEETETLVVLTKIDKIINHIKQHVYDNERTKIFFLANKFNMSQSSISTFFKKKTGESIHQFVTRHKMSLVEYRLQNTEFTIAEIANQLGYTDESHLTKTFKKHFEMSPKQYRKKLVLNE